MTKGINTAYYQLAVLLKAGLPITRSLETVAKGSKGQLKEAFAFIYDQVHCGCLISEAMTKKKRIFPPFDVTMVAAAEESGNLDAAFEMLAYWYDLRLRLYRRLLSAMVLPTLVLHIAVFVGPLPLVFTGAMSPGEYLYGCFEKLIWVWGIIIVGYFILKLMPKRGIVRFIFDALLMPIPLLGKALRTLAFARFCRSFNMLYSAGIPVITAAELAVNHTDNAIVSKLVENAPKNARNGRPMYTGLNSQLVPTELRYMWETGEESGTLDDTTARLAKMYEELAEEKLRQFIYWLPKMAYGAVAIYIIYLIARNAGYVYGVFI